MPSIGFGEVVVILVGALLIFGPKKLPELARSLGKSVREFRDAAEGAVQKAESDDEK